MKILSCLFGDTIWIQVAVRNAKVSRIFIEHCYYQGNVDILKFRFFTKAGWKRSLVTILVIIKTYFKI